MANPLKMLRDESMDANGALSPISSRSNGTDTETELELKKKVRHQMAISFFKNLTRMVYV